MPETQYSISGSVAIVTGASTGIGQTIAKQFAASGADVVICSRERSRVGAVADEINGADSEGVALAVECDITDRAAVEALVDATVEEFGALDILVNNAGASFMAPFPELSENGWKTIVDINLHGPFHCIQAAYDVLSDGGGAIINISSTAAIDGSPLMAHYGVAKAGIINLTRTLAYELADDDIRINCIAPGVVATEGMESQMDFSATDIDRSDVKRRVGTPAEIADITHFLASPAASYLTGETISPEGVPRAEETHEFAEPYSWL